MLTGWYLLSRTQTWLEAEVSKGLPFPAMVQAPLEVMTGSARLKEAQALGFSKSCSRRDSAGAGGVPVVSSQFPPVGHVMAPVEEKVEIMGSGTEA